MKALLRTPDAVRAGIFRTTLPSTAPRTALSRPLSTLRPARPLTAFSTLPRPSPLHLTLLISSPRPYSTAPNQHQVMQSFGTPFAQFIYTISRIARIITFTAASIAFIGITSFEGAHQYVEHFAMPSSSPSPTSSDEYGWRDLALEESWSGSLSHPGTDPRLGIKGRHAVRSAWMCVNWGGGIAPSVLFGGSAAGNSGLGRTAITSMAGAKTLRVDDGMILAMQYLKLAFKIAESKGIILPNTSEVRAGLVKGQVGEIDPLAVALEARLASVKERQGSRGALESAIGSYEKLYDLEEMKGGRGDGGRMVRLATKLGDLYSALGGKEEAEGWLRRAVGIAAAAGAHTPVTPTETSIDTPASETSTPSKPGLLKGWFSSPSPQPAPVEAVLPQKVPSAPVTSAAPTPVLTRSLISTLISLSALHAQSSSLPEALQTQMSALDLTSAELSSLPSPTSSLPAELHKLWLEHHQSILDLHVAETVYALTTSSTKPTGLLPKWWKGSKGRGGEAVEWVKQADMRAEGVVKALQEGVKGKEGLGERWGKSKEVKLWAERVLRDAKRVRETAGRSLRTLEGK